ncbi:MAG: FHA domain-containing protein [Muribaculaceae bacterium]|nr:FHA domain-containing protein [Muribaculaceae bacterium]
MTQQTATYKRTMSGSVGSGMKSVFGNKGRRYYILEHKVSSKYHKAGESQKIIIDQIELGRDPKCQVRFDEQFSTVSRRHAAIVRDGDNWKIIPLSQTNSTYLNGHKIDKEWYLQSGDEIQLSTNGPKVSFIAPSGDKGLVKSIGMTQRLNLFRKQALRPYKAVLSVLACLLIIGALVGGYFIWNQHLEIEKQNQIIAENEARHKAEMAVQDSLLNVAKGKTETLQSEIKSLKGRVGKVSQQQRQISVATGSMNNSKLSLCEPNIYFVTTTKFDVTLPDGETATLDCRQEGVPSWSGTGFMLDNGKFVTARHVVFGWDYWIDANGIDETLLNLNRVANSGGKVVAHFVAISSSGRQLNLSSSQFVTNKSADRIETGEDGTKISLANPDNDFAYCNAGGSGLKFDSQLSRNLERGTKLTVLGFPFGLGVSQSKISPILGSAVVASSGLQQGRILTTDTSYEQGCSGGPVFAADENGNLIVVGIVSASAGKSTGFIIPISVIK